MKVDLYSQAGVKTGEIDLPKEIFEIEFNEDLVHQALIYQLANGRQASAAHTKTKGEIRGGGRKPYAQKHTGRARQGSTRSPQMRGGGIVFGPRNTRNYTQRMPAKQRRKALFCALSDKANDGLILALERYEGESKTKNFVTLLKKLPIKKDVLVVMSEKNAALELSSRNLPNVKTVLAGYVNIHDLQKYDNVLLLKDAIKKLEEVFVK